MMLSAFLLVAPFSVFSAASALPKSSGLDQRAAPGEPLPPPAASPIPVTNGPVPFANATAKSSGYHNALYFTNWFVLVTRSLIAGKPANNLISGAFTGPTFNHSSFPRTKSPTFSMRLLTLLLTERCR